MTRTPLVALCIGLAVGCFNYKVNIMETDVDMSGPGGGDSSPVTSTAPTSSSSSGAVTTPHNKDAGVPDLAPAHPLCVSCRQALMGISGPAPLIFHPSTHGRTFEWPCPGSLALWETYYDSICLSSSACGALCINNFCTDGESYSSSCLTCSQNHVTEPPYEACFNDL